MRGQLFVDICIPQIYYAQSLVSYKPNIVHYDSLFQILTPCSLFPTAYTRGYPDGTEYTNNQTNSNP